jgi:hypothetical protein
MRSIMLAITMPNVIMLSVVAPQRPSKEDATTLSIMTLGTVIASIVIVSIIDFIVTLYMHDSKFKELNWGTQHA